jgi:multimeric flavodoxin WrbA
MAPLWLRGALVGKLGAAFATAGEGGRGGTELALISMLANLAEHGVLLVPMHNRLPGFRAAGSHWGAAARTNPRAGVAGPTDEQLEAARSQGRFLAECTRRWLAGARAEAAGSGD